jgi:hypothetical protein
MKKSLIPENLIGQFFGVGSVGEKNSETSAKYVKKLPLPYWYQVTSYPEEDMIRQFGYLIDGFEENGDFLLDIDMNLYNSISSSNNSLIPDNKHARGLYLLNDGTRYDFFKTQQTAPITMCYSIRSSDGKQHLTKSMFYFFTRLMKRIAIGQNEYLREFCDKIILCQDDPAFGLVIEKMKQNGLSGFEVGNIMKMTESIYPDTVIPAYHYCDDWTNLTYKDNHILWDSSPKIAHIDLVRYPPSIDSEQAEKLNRFLESGGGLALGVLPNVDDGYLDTIDNVLRKSLTNNFDLFNKHGVSLDLIGNHSMISTQCGLSRASAKLTREIHEKCADSQEIFMKIVKNATR